MFNNSNFTGNPHGIPPYPPQPNTNWNEQFNYGGTSNQALSYGYPYGEDNSGYTVPFKNVTIDNVAYKLDPLSDTYGKEISNNKGKVKVQPLTSGFNIICTYKNYTPDKELRFVVIEYTTKGKYHTVVMPGDDYIKDKFNKYLKEIFRYPSCTKSQFNDLVSFILQTAPSQDITLFSHQGWNELDNNVLTFAANSKNTYIPNCLISESVKRRKNSEILHSAPEIINDWINVYTRDPALMFISYYRIGSLLQFFLRQAGINVTQYLIAEPSDIIGKKELVAMLATNDTDICPVPTLESEAETVLKELGYVFDGIALYTDDSFADEERKRIESLKAIIKVVRQEFISEATGRNLIAIISDNAAYTATKLAPDNVIVVNTHDIPIEVDANQIQCITSEMDALIISTISSHAAEIKTLFAESALHLRNELSKFTHDKEIDTLIMIFLVDIFFRNFLGFKMLDDEALKCFIQTIDSKYEKIMDVSNVIVNDFACILSEHIRSKALLPVTKRRNMKFDNDGHTLILDGERIYLSSESMEKVLSEMTTTHSHESLLKALKRTNSLEYTDGNTHPIELHDSNGKHQRLYFYDISAKILDFDVLYKLHNLASEAYLLCENEKLERDFITFINDGCGRSAGKQVRYRDEENNHVYITGQSGYGKTYLMAQLIAKCSELGHNLVVFDSSDSFTYESLCRNLSRHFVDENIVFIDLDRNGIPVDLFKIDHSVSLPSQKKQLVGILTAGIGELSAPQSNLLRSTLSEFISMLGKDEAIRTEDMLDLLREGDSSTHESLLNRLEPLFEDINACGMTNRSWGNFLKSSGKIVVIRTDPAYTECGNQLIDMLIATLYNYQHDNPNTPLDVFIDEIQNQNFSKQSPIRKIMKEGRKIHLSFFGATQDYYSRNTELGSVMSKADTQIFLRPTPNSENVVALELRFNKADMERFDSMQRGDVIVKGSQYNKEQGRNIPTTLSGHVDDYPKSQDNYYGNVR